MSKVYTTPRKIPEEQIVGIRYNHVVVIEVMGAYNGRLWVKARCDCGVEKDFKLNALRSNNSKSCGECRLTKPSVNSKRCGEDGKPTPTYNSWRAMKERCDNPKALYYKNYGGRGVSYATEWADFEAFYNDMGERPDGMTLDRVDVNEGYSKENCKWADYTEQRFNSRKRSDNSSGRTGVSFREKTGSWYAHIQREGEGYYLGKFESFEEACAARELAEISFYGEVKNYEDCEEMVND